MQFTPVRNGANVGVAGYLTDYLPTGVEVVGASFVEKDGAGGFENVPPKLPGSIFDGIGNRGVNTFLAPFNAAAYDPTGRCAAGGFTNNCGGRLSELHADTGIFFSTDARTAAFPVLPILIAQAVNGYNVSPSAEGQLNPILGQTNATTHNLWDAAMTNAFGSTPAAVAATAAPKSAQAALNAGGDGAAPYMAASPVAGPQTGYTLDYTGAVGPWQRIAYNGSRIGNPSAGPTAAAGVAVVGGLPTNLGVTLSPASPLPANTNAIRFSIGKLVVGEILYVKISLRITAAIPASGLINSAEVWGGDAGDADVGRDNPWRYHVPSVVVTNSNLYVQKNVVCVYVGAVCQPNAGNLIPANSKVRYRISYLNSSASQQTNVVLQDVLPCNTAANAASNITVVSGSITLPVPNPPVTAAGACPATRRTVTFPTLATLASGAGGAIDIDVQTNAANGTNVINTAILTSTQLPSGVMANEISTVGASAFLSIKKRSTTALVAPGSSVTYTIYVANIGTANATALDVYDILPSMGGVSNAATRFTYSATVSITPAAAPSVLAAPVIATAIPPTLAPYSTFSDASNSQQVRWNFGAASVLAPGAGFTITFTALVGNLITTTSTPYTNDAAVIYAGGTSNRADDSDSAPVLAKLMASLSISKNNGVNSLSAGSSTTYTIVANNAGPSAANNALIKDAASAGLQCLNVTCSGTSGGATCPAGMALGTPVVAGSTNFFSSGVLLPTFPSSSSVTFSVVCNVTASGL